MVLVFYLVFMKYKIRNTQSRVIRVISYFVVYLLFVLIVIMLALIEKFGNHGQSQQYFFDIFAQILGYISAVCSGIVWIPQIYTLWKNNNRGSLSPLMFIFQTPGNIVIIIFQAVLFEQSVSTWITYLITCIEQSLILALITYYYIRDRNNVELHDVTSPTNDTSDEDTEKSQYSEGDEVEPLIEIDKVF
jgi:cystinosin